MTLIVNLFAGPGAGKSTTRAGVFHKLKLAGYNVEEAPEFAKELTWEQRKMALGCQPYVFAHQLYSLHRLQGQVAAIITDSPLLLGNIYASPEEPNSLRQLVSDKFHSFDNINFYIQRVKPYNPSGRNQTEQEAHEIDGLVYDALVIYRIPHEIVKGDEYAVDYIVKQVMERLH